MASDSTNMPTVLLLDAVVLLIDPKLPWACKTVRYLSERSTITLLREIVLTGKVCISSLFFFFLFLFSVCFGFSFSLVLLLFFCPYNWLHSMSVRTLPFIHVIMLSSIL